MEAMKKSTLMRASLLLVVASVCVSGCRREEARGVVSGTVTCDGKAVTQGLVLFGNSAMGIHLTAKLDDQGRYQVMSAKGVGLPPGEYEVSVNPPAPDFAPGTDPASIARQSSSNIPLKYRNAKTSGLTLRVTKEGATFDIDMCFGWCLGFAGSSVES
jgi:hypothetical protein